MRMQETISVATAPKTGTFQMRINPEVKQQAEKIYSRYGLTLTDAVNVFLQQSINTEGLPFLLSPENSEFIKAQAMAQLMNELQKGVDSVHGDADWISEADMEDRLGIKR